MAGFETIKAVHDFEQTCYTLGFEIAKSTYHRDSIALKPMYDCYPHYSRDAELFTGSIEEAILWLRGLQWAREYDDMIRLSTDKKRKDCEQKERNRQLMKSIKAGHKVDGKLDVLNGETYEPEYDDQEVPF
jgi:hypothetical protein